VRETYREELDRIHTGLVGMAGYVAAAIGTAGEALEHTDLEQAQDVIAGDAAIDAQQAAVDERIIRVLSLQGPVAGDLRMLVSALRISANLERMGDLARHLGQLTRLRYPLAVIPEPLTGTFREMAAQDAAIAADVRELIDTRDLALADRIHAANERVNRLHAGNFRAVAAPDWGQPVTCAVDVMLASRYLERFADHGTAVARKITYLVTGQWQPDPHTRK
jgi:phosphate transport system protein